MASSNVGALPTKEPTDVGVGIPISTTGTLPEQGHTCTSQIDLHEEETKPCWEPSSLFMFIITVVIILPVGVIIISFVFGLMLAGVEGWAVMDGFYYTVSTLCGLPAPLTDVTPDSDGGKFADVIIAVWSLSVAGTFIGLIAGMGLVGRLTEWLETGGNVPKLTNVDPDQLMAALREHESLNFQAFAAILKRLGFMAPMSDLKQLFDKFDVDGSGDLDREEIEAIGDVFDKAANGADDMTDEQWTKGATVQANDWQVIQQQRAMKAELDEVKGQVLAMEKMVAEMHKKICGESEG